MKILAIDPATKTGWAHSSGVSGVWDLSIRRGESAGMRLLRLRVNLGNIKEQCGIDLVAYESAILYPTHNSGFEIHSMLQSVIVVWCEDNGIEYRGYKPPSIKKHATGRGNAKKDQVLGAACLKWNHIDIKDDNQADALWLLDLVQTELDELAQRGKGLFG